MFQSPGHEEEVAEGRRLGGLRRRREKTLAGAYDIESLTSVAALRRLLEIAAFDVLSLENSLARSRTLVAVVTAGSKLLEVGELQARIALLEPPWVGTRGATASTPSSTSRPPWTRATAREVRAPARQAGVRPAPTPGRPPLAQPRP